MKQIMWTPELVSKFWNVVGKSALSDLSFSRLAGRRLFAFLRNTFTPGMKIIDFGAGDGDFVKLVMDAGFQCSAFEVAGARQQAWDKLGISDHPCFIQPSEINKEEYFDCLCMIEVIEHVLDQELEGVLSVAHSLLKKGGTLIVTTPNNVNLSQGMAYCPISEVFFHRWQHVRSFTANSLVELLAKSGFKNEYIHQVDFSQNVKARGYSRIWTNFLLVRNALRNLLLGRKPLYDKNIRIGNGAHLVYIGTKI